jgi:hypothetical protein
VTREDREHAAIDAPPSPGIRTSAVARGGDWGTATAAELRPLFRIGAARFRGWVALRVGLAVGLPIAIGIASGHVAAGVIASLCAMLTTFCDVGDTHAARLTTMACGGLAIIGGGALGAQLGGTPHANELLVMAAALTVGILSGPHPGVTAIARFFALGVVAGAGIQWPSADFLLAAAGGALCALAVVALIWTLWPGERGGNLLDWRETIARNFAFDRPDYRFAIGITLAAGIALFAASSLHLNRPYWAAVSLLLVMRREGTESMRLTLHYAVGTILGVVMAATLTLATSAVPVLATVAVLAAAVTRIALSLNPSLGFTGFTLFLLLLVDIALPGHGYSATLWTTRLYDVAVGCALSIGGTLLASALPPLRLASHVE